MNNEIRISNMLKALGITCNLSGYDYIKMAVEKILENPNKKRSLITKIIYPEIAKYYNSNPPSVERSIRHAIEQAWKSGNIEMLDTIFSHSIDVNKTRATNTKFLFSVAEYLKLHPDKFIDDDINVTNTNNI